MLLEILSLSLEACWDRRCDKVHLVVNAFAWSLIIANSSSTELVRKWQCTLQRFF